MKGFKHELSGAALGDARLTQRFISLVEQLAVNPDASLPESLPPADLEAAYRFVNNEKVTVDALLAPHAAETATRCAAHATVLVAHDSSECKYGGERAQLGRIRATAAKGYSLHLSLAIADAQTRDPLGVLAVSTKCRTGPLRGRASPATRYKDPARESFRWGAHMLAVEQQLGPGRAIHLADREGDAYELLASLQQHGARFVIRQCHDRRLADTELGTHLDAVLGATPIVGHREVAISKRGVAAQPASVRNHPPRDARPTMLAIGAMPLTVRRPWNMPASQPATLALHVVHVREVDAPADADPIEWTLLTTEPIATPEQMWAIVDAYRARWLIEEYFKTLKTGCSLEKRQNESLHALENVLGLYLPIAWQLLRLRTLARTAETTPAAAVLSPSACAVLRRHPRTAKWMPANPTVVDAMNAIAALGGHIKNNGRAGLIVLGRGYQALLALIDGWDLRATTQGRPEM